MTKAATMTVATTPTTIALVHDEWPSWLGLSHVGHRSALDPPESRIAYLRSPRRDDLGPHKHVAPATWPVPGGMGTSGRRRIAART